MYRLRHPINAHSRLRLAAIPGPVALLLALVTSADAAPSSAPADVPGASSAQDAAAPARERSSTFAGGLAVGVGVAGVFGRNTARDRAGRCEAQAPPPPDWSDALWQVNTNGELIARNRTDIELLRDSVLGVSADLGDVVRFDKDATVHLRGARLVALGAGEVSADSRHAVNGAQLFAATARVAALEYTQRYARVGADALSLPAEAGHLGTAMGSDARAQGAGSTAIGSFATALGRNSVALGRAAIVLEDAHDGFSLGSRSRVLAENGMAIGASTQVWEGAHDSVALGFGSIVQNPFEVSVGGQGIRRRITNVMPGIAADDVVSVRQLSTLADVLGTGIDAQGAVRGLSFAVQGKWHGTVAGALDALDDAVSAAHDAVGSMGERVDALAAQQGKNGQGAVVVDPVAAGASTPADAPLAAAGGDPAGEGASRGDESARGATPRVEAPLPPVDARAVDDAVQRANAYTDQALAGVDRRMDRLDRRMNRLVAMGSAQAAMAMNTAGLPTWNRLGAGIGHADGEAALAVGYQRVLDRRATTSVSLSGAFSQGGEHTVALGMGIGW
ncbi:YadA-like family protein [Stenotrophomonas sp. PD6]|uniref:YadA-like family protein n=1 Tax=Stenotrophomonas sp. PD6 TaxID=3368612 RepID=UPI003BA1B76C